MINIGGQINYIAGICKGRDSLFREENDVVLILLQLSEAFPKLPDNDRVLSDCAGKNGFNHGIRRIARKAGLRLYFIILGRFRLQTGKSAHSVLCILVLHKQRLTVPP